MEVTFEFHLGDKVVSEDGIVGIVTTNSITRGMNINRVAVDYVTDMGKRECEYFYEDELELAPEDE